MKRQWHILIVLLMSMLLGACPNNQMAQYPAAGQSTLSFKALLPEQYETSIWAALSNHFIFDDTVKHRLVIEQVNYLMHHQEYLNRLTENAAPYLYYVYQQTRKRHMPAEIALLPMIESNYNPLGVSPASGATGLWQMMPGTATGYGLKINWWYDGRRDIVTSTTAALNYLAVLHSTFGSWLLAMAAYNAGAGTVAEAIKHNQRLGLPTDYWSLPLPYETRVYVPRLLALANIISNAREYKLTLPNIPNKPYFKAVTLHNQVNIDRVAELSDTSVATIRELNPGFRQSNSAVPAGKSFTLLLPENKPTVNLAELSSATLSMAPQHGYGSHRTSSEWIHHSIKPGESLYALADRYHTSVAAIKRANDLRSDTLRPGESLLIPEHGHHSRYIALAHSTRTSVEHYRVRSGDSLSKIAERFNTNAKALEQLNHLHSPMLKTGLVLSIPAHYAHLHAPLHSSSRLHMPLQHHKLGQTA